MRIISLILMLSFSDNGIASSYRRLGKLYKDTQVHTIDNYPTIRTQDGVGICYAVTVTQLLNYQYCKQNKLNCKEAKNQISLLDVTAYSEYYAKTISEGGYPHSLLRSLKQQTDSIFKEQCLPFELLSHKDGEKDKAQGQGYKSLREIYDKHPRYLSPEEQMCHAKTIKSILSIEKDIEAILNAFQATSVAQFVYEVAVKDECLDEQQKIDLPDFHTGVYPSFSDQEEATPESLLGKVEKLVLNDIPVGISFCTNSSEECGAHAVSINGIKEVCNKDDCRIMLKLHNSYGQSWQNFYNGGWVDGENLMRSALQYNKKNLLTWISEYKSEKDIPEKTLKRSRPKKSSHNPTIDINTEESDTFPDGIDPKRSPVFKCDGNYFGGWKPNSNCKFMMYSR